jgi:membrane protease YdiL (CAAX protease family)
MVRGINLNITLLLLVFGLGLLMMPVNSWLSAFNQALHLPSFLDDFQRWAMAKEFEMEKLTLFLVDFSSPLEMVLGFMVVSLIAGFSEEYFFRKLLQPRVMGIFGNPHAGIWITAFIFSAIHVQFYGLFPRMVLGALFGYYYWWTGNIWLSVFAHSLNNAITLIGISLYKADLSPINVEDPQQIPWFLGAIAAGVTWSLASLVKEEADKIRYRKLKLPDPEIQQPSF